MQSPAKHYVPIPGNPYVPRGPGVVRKPRGPVQAAPQQDSDEEETKDGPANYKDPRAEYIELDQAAKTMLIKAMFDDSDTAMLQGMYKITDGCMKIIEREFNNNQKLTQRRRKLIIEQFDKGLGANDIAMLVQMKLPAV